MIVEDGTSLTDANSYVDLDFADSYFSSRGVSEWNALETEVKEQALIRATDYIDNIFQWCGKKATPNQSLRFPRVNLKDYEGNAIEGIPTCLKQAVCDATILTAEGETLFQSADANGSIVSESIGQLSFSYSKNSSEKVASISLHDSINTKLRGLFVDTSKTHIQVGRMHR